MHTSRNKTQLHTTNTAFPINRNTLRASLKGEDVEKGFFSSPNGTQSSEPLEHTVEEASLYWSNPRGCSASSMAARSENYFKTDKQNGGAAAWNEQ